MSENSKVKHITIGDFLTKEQVDKAIAIYKSTDTHALNKRLVDEVLAPNMDEINRKIGQENDPRYLAYMLEAAFDNSTR